MFKSLKVYCLKPLVFLLGALSFLFGDAKSSDSTFLFCLKSHINPLQISKNENSFLIKNNPNSRRMIVTGWNPKEADQVALPPCHTLFQFYVQDGRLSAQLYQRSGDIFLGVPFNIASYALLTMMIAQCTGLQPGEFVHTLGDAHLYSNHLDQARLQLTREPRHRPKMTLNPEVNDIFGFQFSDFQLSDYKPYPHIRAKVAV